MKSKPQQKLDVQLALVARVCFGGDAGSSEG